MKPEWGGPIATPPTNGYNNSSSRQLCSRREFCNRLVLLAPGFGWISSLRATPRSTLAAVPQIGRGTLLEAVLAVISLPPPAVAAPPPPPPLPPRMLPARESVWLCAGADCVRCAAACARTTPPLRRRLLLRHSRLHVVLAAGAAGRGIAAATAAVAACAAGADDAASTEAAAGVEGARGPQRPLRRTPPEPRRAVPVLPLSCQGAGLIHQ